MIPPAEVRQAVLCLLSEQVGVGRDEVPSTVARALGFRATSGKFKELVARVLEGMAEAGEIALRDEKVFLP
jgi:hypothetical protein